MMTPALFSLLLAALFWIALHIGVAGSPVRGAVIGRIGARRWRGLFASLSVIGLVWLGWAYALSQQPDNFYGLRLVEDWMLWVPLVVMPFALVLFVGAVSVRNPTAVGGEAALQQAEPATGILRITRHPMLWSFALWAVAHLLAKGDLGSLLLFGSILVTALAGMASIDRKRAATSSEAWARFRDRTSVLPFGAILAGRNRLIFAEIGWKRIGIALVAWLVLLVLHPFVFGVAAIPG